MVKSRQSSCFTILNERFIGIMYAFGEFVLIQLH